MGEMIVAIILFMVAITAYIISFRSFKEKGFLFNNAYIYASKQERETMDKKPHYRQTALVFLLIGTTFLMNGLMLIVKADWLLYVILMIMGIAIIYAIISSIMIEKKKKK